jgi:hypothetical protein
MTYSPAENVLPRLECVKETGTGRGIARCPAHNDKSPSLTWRICEDGMLLVKCWAGCSAHDIVDALGLKLRDLFSAHHIDRRRLSEPHLDSRQALAILRRESTVVMIAADYISKRIILNDDDIERVQLAAGQIRKVAESARWRT